MEDGSPGAPRDDPRSLIDRHVGSRLREHRVAAGLPIGTVAKTLGVAVADVKAWESGRRRIPPSYLLATSTLLSCPLTAFFDGFPMATSFDDDVETSERDVTRLFSHYSDAKH